MKEPEYAYYPLTLFDGMFQDAGVVTGWFVEGLLDLQKVDYALSRLVTKWPMLAGRLERTEVCHFIYYSIRGILHIAHRKSSVSGSESPWVYSHLLTSRIRSPRGIPINQSRIMFNFLCLCRLKYFLRPSLWILWRLIIRIIGPTRISPSCTGISHISKLRDSSTPASG